MPPSTSNKQTSTFIGMLLLISIVLPAVLYASPSVNYIYIESNEGNSSGGHVALQFEEDIYHFQYADPGIIRLEKQHIDDFEFIYRFAANRSLHSNQITVSEQTYSLLRDHFSFQYQTQYLQFKLLDDLSNDQSLLTSLLPASQKTSNNALPLKAAGLFFNDTAFSSKQTYKTSATTLSLHNEINKTYGNDYLTKQTEKIIAQIKSLRPTQWQKVITPNDKTTVAPFIYSFTNRYIDLTAALLAIKVIKQNRDLITGTFSDSSSPLLTLSNTEITALKSYRTQLNKSLIKLVNSNRPDRGSATLINIARLITIDQSIKLNKFVFIDTFDSKAIISNEIALDKYSQHLQKHLDETQLSLLKAKSALTGKTLFAERNYSQLELLANHYNELYKASSGGKSVRFYGAKLIPSQSIALPLLIKPELSAIEIKQNITQIKRFQSQYLARLKNYYSYNLISKNCVTEIFSLIDNALLQNTNNKTLLSPRINTTQHMGGYINTSISNFIPITSHYAVRNNFNIDQQKILPSFRLTKLEQFYSEENDLLVYLRESNTLSSSLYHYNEDDSFFIFFTDNELLLRPVFGAVNTLAGVSQTILGLFTWPFDSGKMLSSGSSGIFMSVAELFFINMRKGSYKYLPYSNLSNAETNLKTP